MSAPLGAFVPQVAGQVPGAQYVPVTQAVPVKLATVGQEGMVTGSVGSGDACDPGCDRQHRLNHLVTHRGADGGSVSCDHLLLVSPVDHA